MKSNVLLLVVDSLRYDAIHNNHAETPTLERLSSDGITFTRCFSQGISTAPSMTAMLTGRYPLDYGGHWYLEEGQPTMAEEFRRNGYTTGAIHSNPNVSRLRNFHRGFDTFEEHILPFDAGGLTDLAPNEFLRYTNKLARLLRRTPYMPAENVNNLLLDWIESTDRPWFLWTQYMDVHGPYLPGDDVTYRNKFRAERLWRKAAVTAPEEITEDERDELWTNYRKEVECLDREIGSFLGALEARGELDNTVVVVTGDHGDEFGEHGRYGHKNLPYDELTHVPLIIRFSDPVAIDQPAEVDTLIRTMDVLPTLLDQTDANLSPGMKERMAGESLLPVIRGADPGYGVVITEKEMRAEESLRFGLRTDSWKYLYDGKADEHFLFDISKDPDEVIDRSEDEETTLDWFKDRLEGRLERIERTSSNAEAPSLEEQQGVEERLKALGYK